MSILGSITDSLESIIVAETTLLDLVQGGTTGQVTKLPYAIISYGRDVSSAEGLNGTVDSHLATTITVFSDDWDATQTAIEELLILFMDSQSAHLNTLTTANTAVTDFNATGFVPATMNEGDVSHLSKFIGQVMYDLHLRYDYT